MSYSYYNMSTNRIGDVIRAICKDAGVYNVELDFTTPEGVLEPTVGLTEWTYEDRKTHFDCLREIITSYMPELDVPTKGRGIIRELRLPVCSR